MRHSNNIHAADILVNWFTRKRKSCPKANYYQGWAMNVTMNYHNTNHCKNSWVSMSDKNQIQKPWIQALGRQALGWDTSIVSQNFLWNHPLEIDHRIKWTPLQRYHL
jgi:hypothetical protein